MLVRIQASDPGCAGLWHFDLFTQRPGGREGHETFCFDLEIVIKHNTPLYYLVNKFRADL